MMASRRLLLLIVLASSGLALRPTATPTATPAGPDAVREPGADLPVAFTTSATCGRCHRDIHRYWKSSMHAQSADDWLFQDAYQALRERGDAGSALCVRCHAPAAVYGGDESWERKVTWEGVTCDFCHRVTKVDMNAARAFTLSSGPAKSGPLRDAKPFTHAAQYSDVHTSSNICQPCHQFVNSGNVAVLSTYSEWQGSEYAAKNVTCQSCHMRTTSGQIVDPRVARVPQEPINLHEMPGGHSVTELNRALQANITAERRGDTVDVVVQVNNRGAGHMVPTGSPLRTIEMVVEVDSGIGKPQRASRLYGRVIKDAGGKELKDEAGVWLRGAQSSEDTRLKPGERRVERLSFNASAKQPVRATAKFYYRYTPNAAPSDVPFLTVSAWTPAQAARAEGHDAASPTASALAR